MGIDADCVLNAQIAARLPELIQISASAKETTLLSRGSAKSGIAIDAVALLLQIPNIINPLAHNRVRIGFDLIIPFSS